jgi:hypothetical protein
VRAVFRLFQIRRLPFWHLPSRSQWTQLYAAPLQRAIGGILKAI